MLDMYIRFDTEGRNSSYIKSHLQELNFIRNLQEICYQVFPYGDKPPLDKGESGPKIIAQLNPTPSVAKVMAVLLLAAGKSSPDDQLLVRIASDWEHVEAQVNGKADERIQMDCVVTPEKIKAELAGLADLGVGVPN